MHLDRFWKYGDILLIFQGLTVGWSFFIFLNRLPKQKGDKIED